MLDVLNANAGAIAAVATAALLLVTAFYAWVTYRLFGESRQTRLMSSTPRIVAYLRVHEVHSNMVQLCIANLSGAAASGVTASVDKITEWPEPFEFQDSKMLRDLSFLSPHEVLKFDLGVGPDLFRDNKPAEFQIKIRYESLDGRLFAYEAPLKIESVLGHGNWKIYGIDDVARRLKDIADTLQGFTGFRRLRVETFTSTDRKEEHRLREEQRTRMKQREPSENEKALASIEVAPARESAKKTSGRTTASAKKTPAKKAAK